VGWGKVACWNAKAADSISETHKDRRNVTIPDPLRTPQDWGFASTPKNPVAIISGTGKATHFKFGRYIHRVHPNKSPLKFWRKEHGRI